MNENLTYGQEIIFIDGLDGSKRGIIVGMAENSSKQKIYKIYHDLRYSWISESKVFVIKQLNNHTNADDKNNSKIEAFHAIFQTPY